MHERESKENIDKEKFVLQVWYFSNSFSSNQLLFLRKYLNTDAIDLLFSDWNSNQYILLTSNGNCI